MNVQKFDVNDSSSESVARKLENANVIKAFNTLQAQTLRDGSGQGLVVFMAGDNPAAKKKVAQLVEDAGFVPFDAGPLREGKKQEPGTDRYFKALSVDQAQRLVSGVRSIVGEVDLDQPVRRY
jgi:predicted dinucleotide-binding enzyme